MKNDLATAAFSSIDRNVLNGVTGGCGGSDAPTGGGKKPQTGGGTKSPTGSTRSLGSDSTDA
jgi:hypothetical protein